MSGKKRNTLICGVRVGILLSLAVVPGGLLAQEGGTECVSCHEQGDSHAKSAHAAVSCAKCHERHENYPHPTGIPLPKCGSCHASIASDDAKSVHGKARQSKDAVAPDCNLCHGDAHSIRRASDPEFRQSVPDTCGNCHTEEADKFKASVHGQALTKGDLAAPVCVNCHGEHNIQPVKQKDSTVFGSNIPETCGQCHGSLQLTRRFGSNVNRLLTFEASFHGVAAKSGSPDVANCASCHGYHDILPSSNAKSSVNPRNLSKTCGQCHPGAGERFALGPIHVTEEGQPAAIRFLRLMYQMLIPMTVGLMFLHHAGDWLRKLVRLRLAKGALAVPPRPLVPHFRMTVWERTQHIALALSFMTLVWTGFALRYSDQWWARPVVSFEDTAALRGSIHRFAGVVLLLVGLIHGITLLVSRRHRDHWKELFPRMSDLRLAIRTLAYNMCLTDSKPAMPAHSYVEKAEYWAVVWGTLVMGITGIMLWATNFMLAFLPKVWLDFAAVLHFYEAVLAAFSILVWHFYWVMFDPEVYPMDPAWLTGESPRSRTGHGSPPSPPE